ncbi:AAA family ATPase [Aeromonas veronii]|uniref:AAA family ATPase n=1 Tax=Aeromonas veronii TaxID=654 RepID=UPI0018F17E9E|nr:AAA family ATPase [Aeromonas veronii]MBJ7589460.1 ATP-binding protein [Aeromonas veronii]
MKQIQRIKLELPYMSVPINIDLAGKNLIVTGSNGCGKTSFIKNLNNRLISCTDPDKTMDKLISNLNYARQEVSKGAVNSNYTYFKDRVSILENEIEDVKRVVVSVVDENNLRQEYADKRFVLSYYPAERQSNISVDSTRPSLNALKAGEESKMLSEHFGVLFEKYLVAQKVIYNDIVATQDIIAKPQADRVAKWLEKVQSDLRYLFEDTDLHLTYNREKQSFEINQEGKSPFQFNELSSGFSAIMYIYSDLLMKVELKDIPADKLNGIVLIDEIDAHLHVSLQRRILSFFTHAFPSIQFIVTTHSPFVVQSVGDAIIYDLSKREQLEDLSKFSYQAILEGLLGVSINSMSTEDLLDELDDAINIDNFDLTKVSKLYLKLAVHEKDLSPEAVLLLLKTRKALVKSGFDMSKFKLGQK